MLKKKTLANNCKTVAFSSPEVTRASGRRNIVKKHEFSQNQDFSFFREIEAGSGHLVQKSGSYINILGLQIFMVLFGRTL